MQFIFDCLQQIGRFFLIDIELAVARDAKMPIVENRCAGKEVRQEMADHLVEKNIFAGCLLGRELDQPGQHAGNLHNGHMAQRLSGKSDFEPNDHVQRFVQ